MRRFPLPSPLRTLTLAAASLSALWACAARDEPSAQEMDLIERHLALAPQDTVADVGAGRGGHALALARRLPSGRVLATEIDSDKVARITRRARRAELDNVAAVAAGAASTGLSPGCCDAVYMRGVYHHLTDPMPILEDLFQALRPGGRLLVIDFPPSPWLWPWTPQGLPADRSGHGVRPEQVTAEAEAAGFVFESRVEDWPTGPLVDLYGLVLRKPSAGTGAP